ncbi:hypothetical protein [Mycobacterium noviomagense]|uniref:Secreted protein n=1 Tax=Mycobacterium noviomagense TaxID=459858 RepID=A0A7I7PHF4_9MYCO|nr:hypothetical protein [Mycobacterium noviomagense]ORB11321.1 hypothetical protein BST37_19965 [Mycobacterium noviomagense]BBY07979.1 hypothetical protein MNVI_32970 [Mycobacterium noviomagense]
MACVVHYLCLRVPVAARRLHRAAPTWISKASDDGNYVESPCALSETNRHIAAGANFNTLFAAALASAMRRSTLAWQLALQGAGRCARRVM